MIKGNQNIISYLRGLEEIFLDIDYASKKKLFNNIKD